MKKVIASLSAMSMVLSLSCGKQITGFKWVGYLVDGTTSNRLSLFKASGSQNNLTDDNTNPAEVYVLVDGQFQRAVPCTAGDANSKNAIPADGCFQVKNLPTGVSIPVFAQYPGYQSFEGSITHAAIVDSTGATQAATPIVQDYHNIRLFPTGFAVNYNLHVQYTNGSAIPGVTINCQLSNEAGADNSLTTFGEDFLSPKSTQNAVVSVTTDNNGNASVGGLVAGGFYKCISDNNATFQGHVVSGSTTFTAGVSAANQTVTLSEAAAITDQVYAVFTNNEDPNALLGPQFAPSTAKLVVTFNRPVEIIPGTEDCQTATLAAGTPQTGVTPASPLPTEVLNNGVSERVTTSISPDKTVLTLSFVPGTTAPNAQNAQGSSVTFSGILLRPSGIASNLQYNIGGAAGNGSTSCGNPGNVYGTQATGTVKDLRNGGGAVNATIKLF